MHTRKIAAILMSIALLLPLFGCGSVNETSANAATTGEKTSTEQASSAESSATPTLEKVASDDFSKGTSEKSIENIIYQVPSSWEESSENHTSRFYPKNKTLPRVVVCFDEMENISITDDGILSAAIDGFFSSMDNPSLSTQGIKTTSSGIPCGYAEFSAAIDETELNFILAMFDCQGGMVYFILETSLDEETDYTNDFHKILNSIEVVKDLTQGAVGDYYVSIGDCSFTTDYHGEKTIIISYDFTNNSSETVTPMWKLNTTAFQDGIELELAVVLDGSAYDAAIKLKEIRPDTTLTGCQIAYVLRSDSPVEFEVGPLLGKPVLFKTYNVE